MEFYYKHLTSETEKTVYRDLKHVVENHESSLYIPTGVSSTQISRVFMYLLMDYPDFFWTKGDFTLYENIDTEKHGCRIDLHYLYSEKECQSMGKQIQESIMNICACVQSGASQENIVRTISAWFMDNVSYSSVPSADQTIYSALVMKKSVCMGISRAIKLVLRLFETDSIVVLGSLFQECIHAWNVVHLDGSWYHLDVTASYKCFDSVWADHGIQDRKSLVLVKDRDIEETHSLREKIIFH